MIIINSIFYIYFIFLLFFIGFFGVLMSKKNLILFLISIEIMFLSANLAFVVGSHFCDDVSGTVFSIFVLGVAANEIAVGLALFIIYSRRYTYSKLNSLALLKG